MLKIADYILSGALMSGLVLYLLSKLSGNKLNFKSIKTYVVFIVLGIIESLNYHFMNGYIKIVLITLFIMLLYYFYFEKNVKSAIINPIMVEFIIIAAEFIFSFIIMFISIFNFTDLVNKYFGTGIFLINLIISIISLVMIKLPFVHDLYTKVLKWTEKISDRLIVVLMMLVMITINVVYSSVYYKLDVKILLLVNIFLLLIYVYIVMKMLNEKDRYIRISSKYNVTTASLNELREVVNILKINNHENKNQIKTIRNMIKKKDKNVVDYIDTLLGDKIQDDEKLMMETAMITNSVISSLVYSKMLTMQEKGINASLHVDKMVEKLNLYDLDDGIVLYICKIIGVWLDNAIEAVTSSSKKNIDIQIYVDLDNDLNITISNNFNNEVNLDIIDEKGYTTKGKDHGYGLSLVKEIVDKSKRFRVETRFKNNIFIQNLKVKM